MSFFRVIGGRVDANTVAEVKVLADGTVVTETVDGSVSGKLDNAIINNTAFIMSGSQLTPKGGYYTLFLTVPDAPSKLFYIDWSFAMQREGSIQLVEGVTTVGTPTAKTFENRNRNSATAATVTAGSLVNSAGAAPAIGGTPVYSHYFPTDTSANHPDGGRVILKNNTVYAFAFGGSNITENQLSVRVDLYEIDA